MRPRGNIKSAQVLAATERRERVAELIMRGLTHREIAAKEGVDHSTITRDLAKVRKLWEDRAATHYAQWVAEEIAKTEKIEKEAWAAYERSCRDEETIHAGRTSGRATQDGERLPDLVKSYKSIKSQAGDARFLELINKVAERRNKICRLISTEATAESLSLNQHINLQLGQPVDPFVLYQKAIEHARREALVDGLSATTGVGSQPVTVAAPTVEVPNGRARLSKWMR
jgi:hypothetical protein